MDNNLLILDLDETVVSSKPLNSGELYFDFVYRDGPVVYTVKKRPGLEEFLHLVKNHYKIAVWSAAEEKYVNFVVDKCIKPIIQPVFVWSGKRTTIKRLNIEMDSEFESRIIIIKDLKKLWAPKSSKYNKYNTVVVDDNYTTFMRNYGNAIPISEFNGNDNDKKLEWLWNTYLSKLTTSKNIRHDLTALKNNTGWTR